MPNATALRSHQLQLLWLAQWEDYGIGCGFAGKLFMTLNGKGKVHLRTGHEGPEGGVV
jgi:hypothetical protein